MKIEVGKKYVLNNGDVRECERMNGDNPLEVDGHGYGPFVIGRVLYHQDGRFGACGLDYEFSVKREYFEGQTMVSDTPKLWRDMTDAEKGAMLLAKHDGKTIQFKSKLFGWIDWDCETSLSESVVPVRIKPTPKVETKKVWIKSVSYTGRTMTDILADVTYTDGEVTAVHWESSE